jgi:hypothetical protein
MIALNQYGLLRGAPESELLAFIARALEVLEGQWLESLALCAGASYESQLKYTPEYYRLEKIKKEEKRRAVGKALERPGFILIAWAYCMFPHSTGPTFRAFWLPETGPRWVCHGFGKIEEAASIEVSSYRCGGRERTKEFIQEMISLATGEWEYGPAYETPALHLLDKGPDRRAAYLRRIAEAAQS